MHDIFRKGECDLVSVHKKTGKRALSSVENNGTMGQSTEKEEAGAVFWHRKEKKRAPVCFDRAAKAPVIRQSICTGEKTACLRDRKTGKLEDIMLIRTDEDLREFLETYGVREEELETVY